MSQGVLVCLDSCMSDRKPKVDGILANLKSEVRQLKVGMAIPLILSCCSAHRPPLADFDSWAKIGVSSPTIIPAFRIEGKEGRKSACLPLQIHILEAADTSPIISL